MAKIFAVHPGEILLHEFMEPMGLSSYRLAKEIGVPLPRVNDIALAKRSISANTALRLGRYFGNSPQFWMNLQNRMIWPKLRKIRRSIASSRARR